MYPYLAIEQIDNPNSVVHTKLFVIVVKSISIIMLFVFSASVVLVLLQKPFSSGKVLSKNQVMQKFTGIPYLRFKSLCSCTVAEFYSCFNVLALDSVIINMFIV